MMLDREDTEATKLPNSGSSTQSRKLSDPENGAIEFSKSRTIQMD
jgi:hypothetical protein